MLSNKPNINIVYQFLMIHINKMYICEGKSTHVSNIVEMFLKQEISLRSYTTLRK